MFRRKSSPFLERSLNLSLKKVLPIIQKRIMEETSYFGIKTLKKTV